MEWSLVVPTLRGFEGPLHATLAAMSAAAGNVGGELIVVHDAAEPGPDVSGLGIRVRETVTGGGRGYGAACNAGLRVCRGRKVAFLNDDVMVEGDLLQRLETGWDLDSEAGAVVPDVWNEHLGRSESGCRLTSRCGLLDAVQEPLEGCQQLDYPCGAAVAADAEILRSLGGWEEMYAPGYWEDVDLGLTVRRGGRRIVAVRGARVRHLHGQTMGTIAASRRRVWYERNRVLCSAKHLDRGHLPVFLGFLAARLVLALLKDPARVWGTLRAIPRLGVARRKGRILSRAVRTAMPGPVPNTVPSPPSREPGRGQR